MSVLAAVASSLMWGIADFLGGKASRALSSLVVVLLSQAVGLLVALAAAAGAGALSAPIGYLPWSVAAGLSGACAVVLFYRALAIGTMGIVAPLAALGVVVPVVLGLLGGELPSALALGGIVLAVGGVVATARGTHAGARSPDHGKSVALAIGAALGFGLLQYAIAGGSAYSTVMTMLAMRAASVPLLALVMLGALRSGTSVARPLSWRLVVLVAVIGFFDLAANLLFAIATVSGALAIVAVLGSLYPAVTVLLARVVDHERLTPGQNAGVLVALSGVAMIAVGT